MSFIEGIQAVSSGAAGLTSGMSSGISSSLVPTGGGLNDTGTMTINALAGADPVTAPSVGGDASGFGNILTKTIESLDGVQGTADNLAVQAATGDLKDVHDYTIAASRAQLMTELVVAVRNKGIDAFTEIMRMPL